MAGLLISLPSWDLVPGSREDYEDFTLICRQGWWQAWTEIRADRGVPGGWKLIASGRTKEEVLAKV